MDYNTLSEKLKAGKIVFILDDFEEAAIRLVPVNGKTKAYIKHIGKTEIEIPQSSKIVFDIVLSGNEITKSVYDRY